MKVTTLGIDLAKSIFRLHGVDARGLAVLRRQLTRKQRARLRASPSIRFAIAAPQR